MHDLRTKIAEIIAESSIRYHDDGPLSKSDALEWADAILSLPELRESLEAVETLELDALERPCNYCGGSGYVVGHQGGITVTQPCTCRRSIPSYPSLRT